MSRNQQGNFIIEVNFSPNFNSETACLSYVAKKYFYTYMVLIHLSAQHLKDRIKMNRRTPHSCPI